MNDQPRTTPTRPPAEERPRYVPPRILRKRSVVDATLQITSSQDPKNPNPIGGE